MDTNIENMQNQARRCQLSKVIDFRSTRYEFIPTHPSKEYSDWLKFIHSINFSVCTNKYYIFYVSERPPYFVKQNGGFKGTVATPAVQAMNATGIDFEWIQLPATRMFAELQTIGKAACAPGYYKTPEREKWGKFSKPIYRNSPQALLAREKFSPPSLKLRDILSDKSHRLLVKQSYSYGAAVDRLLEEIKPTTISTAGDVNQMIMMIENERADFMFMAPEEYAAATKELGNPAVKIIKTEDSPQGDYRYILCNALVNDDTLDKINAYLPFIP